MQTILLSTLMMLSLSARSIRTTSAFLSNTIGSGTRASTIISSKRGISSIPNISSCISNAGIFKMHASPANTNTGMNSNPVTSTAELSSLTVLQLKALLRDQGSTVGGTKQKLIQRLTNLAQEQKHNKISILSSMAKKGKRNMSTQAMPPPSLKQQVVEASESQKANAKTTSNDVNGFSKIHVPPNLVKRLDEMGISEPTPIQKEAIPLAIKGRDVMGLAQTGTGKTLAFGLPLVSQMMETNERPRPKAVRGLVLAPTRELANQIAVQLGVLTQNTPIKTFVVVGGQNIKTQINKLQSGTDLLVATPGRLIDLMDRGALSLQATTFLVLDEADLMLDMGFLPSLKKISQKLPKKRQTMLFSATMSKDMNTVARNYLQNPARVEVARAGKTAEKVTQELHYIAKADKTKKLLELLSNPDHKEDRALVFGRTKHGMEKLSKKLIASGFKAGSM